MLIPIDMTCTMFVAGPAFNYLDAPVVRISGSDVPMPYAKSLEEAAMPQIHNVVDSVKKILHMQQAATGQH